MALLDENRLFPADPATRKIARALYEEIESLPIISPHGHTDPSWYALNEPFPDPAQLFVTPDHYVFRMLYSQGLALEDLGVPRVDGGQVETDGRKIWHLFAKNYNLFRGTPSRLWLDYAFQTLFGFDELLSEKTADHYYDHIAQCLAKPEFLPRALFEKFNIEAIATTESPLDTLKYHEMIKQSDWNGKVVTAYRPDNVVDPEIEGFVENISTFGELTGCNTSNWQGYLDAHRTRRAFFKTYGATSTDHGHATAGTQNLSLIQASALFDKVLSGNSTAADAEMFRGQMLTEMAKMSVEDGLVMQIHPGSRRNHSGPILDMFGRDKGFDIPGRTDYVSALKPMLDVVGTEPGLTIILFTLDETAYGRELAPLAGVYPTLRLGPAWWFYDSPEGMMRYRELTTETAGFYNTVGFNDDTRAFASIPARHDVARRVDSAYLANLVMTGRITQSEAREVAHDLTYGLAKKAYKL